MACKPVVVCGHGPSGTLLALYLAKHKIPVVLLEKRAELSREPCPTAFHPPELEMMDAVGIADACIAKGLQVSSWQYRRDAAGEAFAEFHMSALAGEARFPFDLQLDRWEMVRIGHGKLKEDYPDLADVRLGARLNWVQQSATGVTVHVETSEAVEAIDACFVVGADGPNSTLRKLLGIGFSSVTCDERFVELGTNPRFEEYGLSAQGRNPTCALISCEKRDGETALTGQHCVAEKFYEGRAVLMGGACCVHTPRGMHGGIAVIYSAWCVGQKLVSILKRGADHSEQFADYDRHWRPLTKSCIQKHIVDKQAVKQDDLSKKASDPAQAKSFVEEWATLKFVCAGFKVSHHREVLEMPLLDAPVLQARSSSPASLEEQKSVAEAPFKGRLGFGEKVAVLVVDFTLAYVTQGSPNYCGDPECGVVAAVRHTAELLPLCRRKGVPIIFTRVLYDPNCGAQNGGIFVQKVPLLASWREGSKMCEIVPELPVCSGDHVLVKQYPSAFFGTPLSAMLTAQRVDTIVLTGCSTSGCIRATATDAMSHGFRVIVPRECVGDRTAAVHEANLFDINLKVGDVLTKAGVVEHLETLPDSKRPRLCET